MKTWQVWMVAGLWITIIVGLLFWWRILIHQTPIKSSESNSREGLKKFIEEITSRPDMYKVTVLAVKYGIDESSISNLVVDFKREFDRQSYCDPLVSYVSGQTNLPPPISVPEKIKELSLKYSVLPETIASIIVDYETWNVANPYVPEQYYQ